MAAAHLKLDHLIEPTRIHGSLYTNPAIFGAELDRIWRTGWVFVGHASEVPGAGDRAERSIGPWPVVLARRDDGTVAIEGAARCDSVHGFVFGSFAVDGIPLDQHLGDAVGALDRLARLSPAGQVELNRGWLKHGVRANWKMLLENETDGYHPNFVHASIFSVAQGPLGGLFDQASTAGARELGGGHTELVLTPQFRRAGPLSWVGSSPDLMPGYVARMHAAYGAEEADEIIADGPPHVMIFPNLFIAEIQVFVIQPLAVDRTVQHVTALQLAGSEELNRKLFHNTLGSVGPAGLLLADDAEMYERNQRGVQARDPEWLTLKRGLGREYTGADGHRAGHVTDEVTQRAIWRHYRSLMA